MACWSLPPKQASLTPCGPARSPCRNQLRHARKANGGPVWMRSSTWIRTIQMPENLFLEMARRGLRMPIGTDLLLHESSDPEACKHDAQLLGAVVEAAARQFQTPFAFPLMDLTLEKADLLRFFDVPEARAAQFHFSEAPSLQVVSELHSRRTPRRDLCRQRRGFHFGSGIGRRRVSSAVLGRRER